MDYASPPKQPETIEEMNVEDLKSAIIVLTAITNSDRQWLQEFIGEKDREYFKHIRRFQHVTSALRTLKAIE